MRRRILALAAAVLLGCPTVLAFFSGGYFDEPRLLAVVVVWVLVVICALLAPRPLPRSGAGWLALAGLGALAAWHGLSIAWAPVSGAALDAFVRVLLYLGALLAGLALLRESRVRRAVEPALGFGALVVIGYGLAGRLLPGLIELSQSRKAVGRLEQPLTYWNAEGVLAAMGLVLCVRLAGDTGRPRALRLAGAVGAVPLGLGVYLTFSRGAIAAGIAGLFILPALAPTRAQLRAVARSLAGIVVAVAVASQLDGVATLAGSASDRAAQGALMMVVLGAVLGASGYAHVRQVRAEDSAGASPVRYARALPALAVAVLATGAVLLVAAGLGERSEPGAPERLRPSSAKRLTSVESRRYDYWRVGLEAFADAPLQGTGAGGFASDWLRERPANVTALYVHSLPLGMASELGVVGLLALLAFLLGVAACARRAFLLRQGAAAGLSAMILVWLMHALIDWDWEMPAVTLPVMLAAAAVVALSEDARPQGASTAQARLERADRAAPAGAPAPAGAR